MELKRYLYQLMTLTCFFSVTVQAAYNLTELESTPLDIPNTVNTVIWDNTDTGFPNDDDKAVVNIGFDFTFDDTQYNQVRILTNGILQFGANQRLHRDFRNEQLPTDEGDRLIAVYWDDLVDDANSQVTYGNAGSAPNRRFIVNWTNVRAYSNNLRYDFQVVLYENGDIRYRYNNNTANGQSATIGLEIDDSDSIQYSFNQISVETSFDLLFRNTLLILPDPVASYRFDESVFDGTPGELLDSSGNGLSGNTFNSLATDDLSPAIPGVIGSCRYGSFGGNTPEHYAEIADNNLLDFQTEFTAAAWINIDAIPASGLRTVLSKDENYEFHVNSNGEINWWWNNSSGNDREIDSTASITAGRWYHVAVSYRPGNQVIYIDGLPSGSSGFNENLRQNSDPLQIGADQNFSGRFFSGDIDEVNIFDQFLSQSQVEELMAETRPCAASNLCVGSFPDGINTHAAAGEISFGRDSQLFFSPDDRLNTSRINLDGGSTNRSCVSVECQANSTPVPTTEAQPFPDTTGFSTDVTTGNNGNIAIGGVTNEYRTISVGNSSLIGTFTGRADFYIDRLATGNNSILNLVAGNYWIRDLDLGRANTINVIGLGTVRIFIGTNTSISRDLIANSDGAGQERDASQLLIYGYGDLTVERDSTLSGIVYARGNLELERDSFLFGAATAANITLGRDSNVYYFPSALEGADFGGLCEAASCSLGGFRITQPDYALACPFSRAKIDIQAMCDDGSSVKDDYSGTINLTTSENTLSQFFSAASGGSLISDITLDGSESGIASVYLFHQNENTEVAVRAEDSSTGVFSVAGETRINNIIQGNKTEFRTSGFRVTDASNNNASPDNFACGNSTSFRLLAIGEDTQGTPCQLLTGFTGNKDFKAWFDSDTNPLQAGNQTQNTPLVINGTNITEQGDNNAVPSANNLTLTFNSGVADISVAYANSAQIQALHFLHDDSPYGTAPLPDDIRTSTGSFVVYPDRIQLTANDSNSQCTPANSSCSAFMAAGEPFSMTATAQCSNGATADQFIGSVNLSHELVAPAGGNIRPISTAHVDISDSDNGQADFNQSVDEVGVFSFLTNPTANPASYFGVPLPQYRLNNIGRFYPASFRTSLPTINGACSDSFSYMGQDALEIQFSVEALNASSVRVDNYTGSFAFDINVSLVAENNDDGSDMGGRFSNVNNLDRTAWMNGQASYSDINIAFDRSASGPDGPYQDLQIGLQLSDGDAALTGLNMNAATSGACIGAGCDALLLGNTDVRFGSLYLANAFGPETMPLSQRVEARYFDGNNFIVNNDDNACHSLLASNPPLLSTGALAVLPRNVQQNITAGVGFIRYNAPGLGNSGRLAVEYQAPTWLTTEYGTNGDANDYEENPTATITFGQYRGNDRVIYWREVTN